MKVIVAIDDSPYSEELVETVKTRDWPIDTEFKVLSVLEPLDGLSDRFSDVIESANAKRKKSAEELCRSVREQILGTIAGATVHYEIRSGYPKNEIIEAAADWSADRIIIGAHGHRGCPHNLLGSVSQAVARHAPCSVEVVRQKSKSSKTRETSTASAKSRRS